MTDVEVASSYAGYGDWDGATGTLHLPDMTISDVPGSGARLVSLFPLGPLMAGTGLNITVLSYLDSVGFGLIGCREIVPNIDAIAAAVPDALAELLKAAHDR